MAEGSGKHLWKAGAVGAAAVFASGVVRDSDWYKQTQADAVKADPSIATECTTCKLARYGAGAAVVAAAMYFDVI